MGIKSGLPLSRTDKENYKPLSDKCAFADFETNGFGVSGADFICGGLVDMNSDEVHIYHSIDEFINLIFTGYQFSHTDENGVDVYQFTESVYDVIYFHNLEFDGRYIIEKLIDLQLNFEIINRVNRLLMIRIGKFKIVDSYALTMDSLKNLSNVFAPDYAKKELDLSYKVFNPNNPKHIEYLVFDCLALKYVVIRTRELIHQTFGINAGYTTSTTALSAWKTTLEHTLFPLSKEKDEFVRLCYSGGFVACLKGADLFRDVYVYDVNSMYPSVMRDYRFPHGQCYFTTEYEGQGFYEISVDSEDASFLFLSGYDGEGNKTTRTKGKFTSYVTDVEIELALKLGYRVDIVRGLVFEESDYLFASFVDMCEELRLKHGKDAIGIIVKYIQNSLYGKFGTKPIREKIFWSANLVEGKTPYVDPVTGHFSGLYIDEVEVHENFMLPHLAAYTTALARVKLVELILAAGVDNSFYCDTDSVFVNKQGADKLDLQLGKEYGKLKLEAYLPRLLVVAPKLYLSAKKSSTKGFPKYAAKKLEAMLVSGKLPQVEFSSLNSVRSILRSNKVFSKPMTRSIKTLSPEVLFKVQCSNMWISYCGRIRNKHAASVYLLFCVLERINDNDNG